MVCVMPVAVTVTRVEPMPTAVVVATTTWAEFPRVWGAMLDEVWRFLRSDAPEGVYKQGHNVMLYKDDVPYGDPDPSTGNFDVDVFWLLSAP